MKKWVIVLCGAFLFFVVFCIFVWLFGYVGFLMIDEGKCEIGEPFECGSVEIGEGGVEIEFSSMSVYDLILKSIEIENCGVANNETMGWEVLENESVEIFINCDLSDVKKIDEEMEIVYNVGGTETDLILIGRVKGKVR